MIKVNPTYEELMSIHDNRFYNQVTHLARITNSIAQSHSMDKSYICIGMGYVGEGESKIEVLFYYDHPDMFKVYDMYNFVYPRTYLSERENVLKKHLYWISLDYLNEIVDKNA